MTKHIEFFGGKTHGRVILKNGHQEELWFDRDIWFDRDFDGRWLVGVTGVRSTGAENIGAFVVKDATVSAFIELLGRLVVDPDKFADQKLTIGPEWNGCLPE